MSLFKTYIHNFCLAFVYAECKGKSERQTFNKEGNHVFFQLESLPWFFRYPFYGMIIVFDMVFSKKLTLFHRLNYEDRVVKIHSFKKIKFSLAKDFYSFFNSLITFHFYFQEQNRENI